MDLGAVIRKRRAIRKYKKKDIPDFLIREILDLARHAPSSMNGQPWHFIVVRNQETKNKLAWIKNKYCPIKKKMYKADFFKGAAAVVVVCVDKKKSFERGIENAVLATAHLMLVARARGLASVYMSAYKNNEPEVAEEIRKVLAIPTDMDPVTLVPLGYPAQKPQFKKMRPLAEMISYETFSKG